MSNTEIAHHLHKVLTGRDSDRIAALANRGLVWVDASGPRLTKLGYALLMSVL